MVSKWSDNAPERVLMKRYVKRYTPHERFYYDLEKVAGIYNCNLIRIPDAQVTADALERWKASPFKRPRRRPFDGLLVTPAGNLCLELKVNNDTQLDHQKVTGQVINAINGSYFVLHKKEGVPADYSVRQGKAVLFKTTKIEAIIEYLRSLECKKSY